MHDGTRYSACHCHGGQASHWQHCRNGHSVRNVIVHSYLVFLFLIDECVSALKKCCKKRDLGVADANDAGQYERDYGLLEFSGLFGEYLEMST